MFEHKEIGVAAPKCL